MTRGKVTVPLGGYPGSIIHTSPGRLKGHIHTMYIALVDNFIGRPTVFKLFFLHDFMTAHTQALENILQK